MPAAQKPTSKSHSSSSSSAYVTFTHQNTEYRLRLVYWNALIEYSYFYALENTRPIIKHDPEFLAALVRDYYAPGSYAKYNAHLTAYTALLDGKDPQTAIKTLLPKPDFDFATAVLTLQHWYHCKLLPQIAAILDSLGISLQSLKTFEHHRDLEMAIRHGRFSDTSSSETFFFEPPNSLLADKKALAALLPEYRRVLKFLFAPTGPEYLPRLSFDDDALPVLQALGSLPRSTYLATTSLCTASLVRGIQALLPSHDPSDIFADLINYDPDQNNHSLAWFLDTLDDAMTAIAWNYPIPRDYFYLIDSGLLDHPKTGAPVEDPLRATAYTTYTFHRELLVKDFQLAVAHKLRCEQPTVEHPGAGDGDQNDAQFEAFYKKLFYIFDRDPRLRTTRARNRIRELVWSGNYRNESERDVAEQLIEAELEAMDSKVKAGGTVIETQTEEIPEDGSIRDIIQQSDKEEDATEKEEEYATEEEEEQSYIDDDSGWEDESISPENSNDSPSKLPNLVLPLLTSKLSPVSPNFSSPEATRKKRVSSLIARFEKT